MTDQLGNWLAIMATHFENLILSSACEDQFESNIQTREMVAWLLTVLLTILLTVLFTVVIFVAKIRNVRNRKRKLLRRKENEAQEDELEENPGYEASNARSSLCEIMDNPCYIASEARWISETQSGIYESIKLDHFYENYPR